MDALEVTGIKKIIWIDDDFADVSLDLESLIGEILPHIEAYIDANQSEEIVVRLPSAKLNLDVPKDILLGEVSSHLSSLDRYALQKVLEELEGDNTELTAADISVILDFVSKAKIELITMSLHTWVAESSQYSEASVETLFLIDKEFTKEGQSSDAGTDVLKDLIRQYGTDTPPNFILFTHTCRGANEEENLRRDIFNRFKADSTFEFESFNFQVLSKSVAFDKDTAETRLFSCIRAIFVRKLFSQIAYGLRREIIKSIDDINDKLISTNVYGLDKSIFGSSISEGVSEIELLQRIYSLSQRTAVTRMITGDNNIVNELTKLRQLRHQTKTDTDDEPVDFADFIKIRREEFWYSGDDINKTHSQLVCGDIFKLNKREFILLCQPCDTILRENGKRKTNMAVLVPIKKYEFQTEAQFKAKFIECSSQIYSFVFTETNIEHNFWCVSLNLAFPISLDILDLCTFNEFGKVEFLIGQEIPSLLHLDGQRKKFQRFKEISEKNEFPLQVCLDTGIYRSEHGIKNLDFIDGQGWYSSLIRVRRLDQVYSEHALNKYFAYKSRKAFEHDFTRH
jgi:hypothetical protein